MSNSQTEKDPIREDILRGARDLFKRFGFKKTTMEDIAKQIGKSKSALYYYYKTKEEIFEAVVLEDMDCQHKQAREATENVESAPEKFRFFFTTILSGVKEKADQFSIFRADLFENPFLIMNIVKSRDIYVEEYLKNILIYGISRGEVKMMTNTEMDIWARTMSWTMKAIGSKIFLEEGQRAEEHLPFIADSLFNGIAR